MESAPGTPAVEQVAEPDDGDGVPQTLAALTALVGRLDRACEELFAVTPYAGDQSTGSAVDGCVDEFVGALRTLRADADDLRRVMDVARLRRGGGS